MLSAITAWLPSTLPHRTSIIIYHPSLFIQQRRTQGMRSYLRLHRASSLRGWQFHQLRYWWLEYVHRSTQLMPFISVIRQGILHKFKFYSLWFVHCLRYYIVSHNRIPDIFGCNSSKHYPTCTLFSENITDRLSNQNLVYFSTSPKQFLHY